MATKKKAAKTTLSSKPAKAKLKRPQKVATKTATKSSRFVVSAPSPAPVGAVVGGTDPCTCGDAPEEHGRDAAYPGSTACTVEGCGCIAYEADRESSADDEGA